MSHGHENRRPRGEHGTKLHLAFELLAKPAIVLAIATYVHHSLHDYMPEQSGHVLAHYFAEWGIFVVIYAASISAVPLIRVLRSSGRSEVIAIVGAVIELAIIVYFGWYSEHESILWRTAAAAIMALSLSVIVANLTVVLLATVEFPDERQARLDAKWEEENRSPFDPFPHIDLSGMNVIIRQGSVMAVMPLLGFVVFGMTWGLVVYGTFGLKGAAIASALAGVTIIAGMIILAHLAGATPTEDDHS
jgi:hypothetical protein